METFVPLSQERTIIDAAPWLVKSMARLHALPHLFVIRGEMFTLQRSLRVYLSSGKAPPRPSSPIIWTLFLHHTACAFSWFWTPNLQ